LHCAVATSRQTDGSKAIEALCEQLRASLGGAEPDVVVVFFTPQHHTHVEHFRERVMRRLEPRIVVGCPCAGVIGGETEIESTTGLTLWGARWPEVDVVPFHLELDEVDGQPGLVGWPAALPDDAGFIVLADPYSTPGDELVSGFRERYPGAPVVGGLASGSRQAADAQLITNNGIADEGAVCLAIGGGTRLDAVVSQGCRPIGQPFVITSGERNVIATLGGRPAFKQLISVLRSIDERDRKLTQGGAIHVGRVVDERKSRFGPGDLLVRSITNIDTDSGTIALSEYVRPGQTIHFMVRDAEAASTELETLVGEEAERGPASGALLFSCSGRGERFFGAPHHDLGRVRDGFGDIPVAGFFAAGEIGPVGGEPFLHGFTASLAVFRDARSR